MSAIKRALEQMSEELEIEPEEIASEEFLQYLRDKQEITKEIE
jgi:hypothetical protein